MSTNDKLADALRSIQVVAVDADLRATTHRTALETIARKAREALAAHAASLAAPPAQGEWVWVPRVLPFAVLGEAGMAGVFETGNPKHGWDFLLSKVGKSPQPLTDDYIEQHIGPDEDDREAVTAVVREVERAHGIAAAPQPAPAPVQVDDALGRFGHHPDPATDFEVEVTSLQGRLFNAKHAIPDKHGVTESVAQVADAIKRAMTFRVGGVETSVRAKSILRALELDATQPPAPGEAEFPNESGFEQWYVENAFDYELSPIGSRDCSLMRKAWHAAIAALQQAQQPSDSATEKLAAMLQGLEFQPVAAAMPASVLGTACAAIAKQAKRAADSEAQQPGAQAVAIVGDDLYPNWVDDAPDLPPGTKLYAASPPLPLEPEPDLDERDPKSGELVAQWLFRNGFRELAAVVRAQLDMRAPRKAPPPLPEGVSEEDVEAAWTTWATVRGSVAMREILENFLARLAARGEKGVQS